MKRGNHGLDEKVYSFPRRFLSCAFIELSAVFSYSIYYVRKIFRKTNISYPLMRTRTCWYEGVRNNDFLENYLY